MTFLFVLQQFYNQYFDIHLYSSTVASLSSRKAIRLTLFKLCGWVKPVPRFLLFSGLKLRTLFYVSTALVALRNYLMT